MAKREFVMLAHKLDYTNPTKVKQHIGGWWFSEKLDGERCFWDGGVSRGILKSEVPWANCAKDFRYQAQPYATGLWSRYGNVIHAPNWFLDALPTVPLDGELFALNQQKRQFTHSTIKKIVPINEEWRDITYMVFDSPPPVTIFADGIIDSPNFKKVLKDCEKWFMARVASCDIKWFAKSDTPYQTTYTMLKAHLMQSPNISRLHNQFVLPYPQSLCFEVLENRLSTILEWGGEGLIVRDPNARYSCSRVHHLLKVKPFDDMEGTVTGYITGRETDKGSKLLGMMGALVLRLDDGTRLELSGFTEAERKLGATEFIDFGHVSPFQWAQQHAETECPEWVEAIDFPRGSRVTFKYRGKSDAGVPQEARYWRKDERV